MTDDLAAIESARNGYTSAILASDAQRRIIVAGPGTGKTHTFKQVLAQAGDGALALTFLSLLVRDLESELDGLADVYSFHGYAHLRLREHPVDGVTKGVQYFPAAQQLLVEDVRIMTGEVLDEQMLGAQFRSLAHGAPALAQALASGNYYNVVTHDDAVYRVHLAMVTDSEVIPERSLIVVDEFQDFCPLEVSFIEQLATKSPVLIVGDDDQALYGFRNASADDIRRLAQSDDFERFELPYCSRCTEVIVASTHTVVHQAQKAGLLSERLNKDYICYTPGKHKESKQYPTILHASTSVQRPNANYIGRYIEHRIRAISAADIAESHEGGYPTVLIIGPNPYRRQVIDHLRGKFPGLIEREETDDALSILHAYNLLLKDIDSRLGWRILLQLEQPSGWEQSVADALASGDEIGNFLSEGFIDRHIEGTEALRRLREGTGTDKDHEVLCTVLGVSREDLQALLEPSHAEAAEVEPAEPSIMTTSLMGSKGLQAAHVFVVGLNGSHFPKVNASPTDDEVCQLLVALTRTRKSCTLVSTRRLGNNQLGPSIFLEWLKPHLSQVYVDKAYLDEHEA